MNHADPLDAPALADASMCSMPVAPATDHRAQHRARAEEAALQQLIDRLIAQFPEVPIETITRAVHGEYGGYDGSAVRDFVPILVERTVRDGITQRHRA